MRPLFAAVRARLGWLIALTLLAAAAGGYAYYRRYQADQQRQAAQAAIRQEAIRLGDITALVSATGSVLPEQQTELFFVLPGTVAQTLVEVGDQVAAGQPLARLDLTSLTLGVQQARDALTVAELNRAKLLAGPSAEDVEAVQANVRSASAAAGDLQGGAGEQQIAIAQLQYDNQQAQYQALADQYNGLLQFIEDNPQFPRPPQERLDTLKANMENAFYTAEIARLQLELARQGGGDGPLSVAYARVAQARAVLSQTLAGATPLQIKQADLAVAQAATALAQAELRLANAELRAPYAGVIAAVNVKSGEPAGMTDPAVVLVDTTRFHLDVNVDEVDVASLSLGQPVSVTVEALPGVLLSGRVDRVSPLAVPAGGLVNYQVRLVLDATDAPLRAGMTATAEIVVAEARQVVLVPNWAIRRDRRTGQAYASLLGPAGLPEEVAITTGLRGETYTEVTGGVRAGDIAAVSTAREQFDLLGGGG